MAQEILFILRSLVRNFREGAERSNIYKIPIFSELSYIDRKRLTFKNVPGRIHGLLWYLQA